MDDLVLRIQFDNNNKLIIKVSQEDTTSSLIQKIKSLYALHYSKMIQLGSLKDDKGFEIINDIKLSSLFENGDVLCVFVKEIGEVKSSDSNGLIKYDYKNEEMESKSKKEINFKKDLILDDKNNKSINPPPSHKNINLTSLPKTNLPIKEEERSLTMNPIPITEEEKNEKGEVKSEIKKPRKRRTVKPKEDDKKIKENEDKKIKKNEVEDPFSVFEDLKNKNSIDKNPPVDTPSKIQPPVLNPISKENKKDIKELKKKSKVDYNKVDE